MRHRKLYKKTWPAFVVLVFAALVSSCFEYVGPDNPVPGHFLVLPIFESGKAAQVVSSDSLHVLVLRSDTATVVVNSVFYVGGQDSVDLQLDVPVFSQGERLFVFLNITDTAGDTVFRGGPTEVVASIGADAPAPSPITIGYVGIGANASGVSVAPGFRTVFFGDSLLLVASAYDSVGAVIVGTPIRWVSLDTLKADFPDPARGMIYAGGVRGAVNVISELLTGPKDTVEVLVQPVPTSIAVQSGDSQLGAVGEVLSQPVSVKVLASDALGVGGVLVRFSTPDGGSFVPDTAFTDSLGNASTSWTLGPLAGVQQALAVIDLGIDTALVTATAAPGAPDSLRFTVQPTDVSAGSPITPNVTVSLYDVHGNLVVTDNSTSISLNVVAGTGTPGASASGAVQTVGSGVATYSTLTLDSAGVGYRLAAGAPGLKPDTSTVFAVTPGAAATIAVTPASQAMASVGETTTLAAVAFDGVGNVVPDAVISWSSTDPAVVSVDASGLVTAVSNGVATISATSGAATGTSVITVNQVVAGVSVSPATQTLSSFGETAVFTATAFDALGNAIAGASFSWASSNTAVATIDGAGTATAVSDGSSTVTATSGGLSGNATVTVSQQVASVTVTPSAASLSSVGETTTLAAVAYDALGNAVSGETFTWASDNIAAVTVDASGVATAVANGSANISATANSNSTVGSSAITVAQTVASVTVTPSAASLSSVG
ncbi:MAG: Ig-like domain-containing protein, partial [Gemmatimonadota bacterium]|nr:Ig-like domain-containing protein [Gemmatimonadota bacterium]